MSISPGANNIAAPDLPSQAEKSLAELMAFYPAPLSYDPDPSLRAAVDQAIRNMCDNGHTTKKTADHLDLLRPARRELPQDRFPWCQWVKLSKVGPGKRSGEAAEPILALALSYDRHPELHRDIVEWT